MCDDERAASEALTAALKSKALELGADLVGVGPVERWAQAPAQMRPDGHWPGCRYVIVVAIHHPNACVELGGVPTAYDMGPYSVQGDMNERLEYIQFHLGRWLERQGHHALTIAATNIWRFRPYKEVVRPFGPDLSDIHAAAACGLGEMGYHGLLMTPEFGTWQRFCCLMTDAPLVADPMYQGPPLCDNCGICVQKCDEMCGGALAHEVNGEIALQVEDKQLRYADKNMWRCAWSEHFGLTIDVDIPEVVTEEVILEYLARYGRRGGVQGPCLKYCRPPHLRGRSGLKEVPGDAPPDRSLTERIRKMAVEARMATFAVVSATQLHEAGVETEPHLPDCRSVIIVGMDWPADSDPAECGPAGEPCQATALGVRQTLAHMHLDIARELERFGYYTAVRTKLAADEDSAQPRIKHDGPALAGQDDHVGRHIPRGAQPQPLGQRAYGRHTRRARGGHRGNRRGPAPQAGAGRPAPGAPPPRGGPARGGLPVVAEARGQDHGCSRRRPSRGPATAPGTRQRLNAFGYGPVGGRSASCPGSPFSFFPGGAEGLHDGFLEVVSASEIFFPVLGSLAQHSLVHQVKHDFPEVFGTVHAPRRQHASGQRAVVLDGIAPYPFQQFLSGYIVHC